MELLELFITCCETEGSSTIGVAIAMAGTAGEPSCDVDTPGWPAEGLSFLVGAGSTIEEGTSDETMVSCEEPDCSEVGTEKPVVEGSILSSVRYRADVCSADTADNL